jgi:hypothetical protein
MADEHKVVRGSDVEQRGGYLSGPPPETGTPPTPPLFTTKPVKEAPASASTATQQSSEGSSEGN